MVTEELKRSLYQLNDQDTRAQLTKESTDTAENTNQTGHCSSNDVEQVDWTQKLMPRSE